MNQEDIDVKLVELSKDKKPKTNKQQVVKDFIGVSDNEEDEMYRQAYLFYNTGRYKDAIQIFRLLITLNANDYKYTMGLAACYHMMKDYQMAAGTYLVVSTFAPNNPIPFFHASDCYMQIGDKASAMIMLEMALQKAGVAKEYATLKQRAEITLAGLKKELLLKN